MLLSPNEEGRGRIVGATLSQLKGHAHPTLSIDVQRGTHIPNAIWGTPREASVHGSQIQVYGDACIPFMAQMMAAGVPVLLYPDNGGDEAAWLAYVQRDRRCPEASDG